MESPDAPYQEFNFDVARDGRILFAQPFAGSYELIIVRNWLAVLSKRAGT